MRKLEEEDEDTYNRQFSKYIKLGIVADDVSTFYVYIDQMNLFVSSYIFY